MQTQNVNAPQIHHVGANSQGGILSRNDWEQFHLRPLTTYCLLPGFESEFPTRSIVVRGNSSYTSCRFRMGKARSVRLAFLVISNRLNPLFCFLTTARLIGRLQILEICC